MLVTFFFLSPFLIFNLFIIYLFPCSGFPLGHSFGRHCAAVGGARDAWRSVRLASVTSHKGGIFFMAHGEYPSESLCSLDSFLVLLLRARGANATRREEEWHAGSTKFAVKKYPRRILARNICLFFFFFLWALSKTLLKDIFIKISYLELFFETYLGELSFRKAKTRNKEKGSYQERFPK